ncbi:unnamed protein product [Sphagnum troendelagicum]
MFSHTALLQVQFEEKMKQMSEQWTREMTKAKEIWLAGEKARQKAWAEWKTKQIREKQKILIQRLEIKHAEELQKQLEAQADDHRRHLELRERLQQERDEMLEKERIAQHARISEITERYEQQAIELRMRAASDTAAQLDRCEAGRREDKQFSQELLARLQRESVEREECLRKQLEKALEEAVSKKDHNIHELKAQMAVIEHEWENCFAKRVAQEVEQKENELRTRIVKERDEQIELVLEKLENEKDEAIEKNKKEKAGRMAQFLEEKHQLEKKLWEYNTNFTNLKNTTLLGKERAERELEEADLEISSLKKENKTQSQLIEELHDQIVQLKNNMKSQEENVAVCLKGQQEKLEKTLVELQECKTTAQEMRTRKMEELEEVEARVRQAITTKDNVIFGLQEQLLAAHKEIERTEFLLHQEQDAILA